MFNQKQVIRGLIQIGISLSVGQVVGNAVKATTPAVLTSLDKVAVKIGTMIVATIVSDIAAERVLKEFGLFETKEVQEKTSVPEK